MRAHPWWSVFFQWASAFLWMKALAWAEKHSALPVDVEFEALNRWHTTSWHLESCAAGQHLQAFAFLRSRQTFLGWRWAFSWKLHFLLFQLLFSALFCFYSRMTANPALSSLSVSLVSIMGHLSNHAVNHRAEQATGLKYNHFVLLCYRQLFLLGRKKIIKRRPFSTKMGFCGFICGCAFNMSSEFRSTLVFIQIGNYSSLFPWSVDIHLQKEVNHEIACWGVWMKCIHSASWFFLTDTTCLPVFCYAVLQQQALLNMCLIQVLVFQVLGSNKAIKHAWLCAVLYFLYKSLIALLMLEIRFMRALGL